MGIANLEHLFHPASVAVIGASERPGRIGTALIRNLVDFPGRVVPINRNYRQIMGLPAAATIGEVGPIDLAVVAVPIDQTPTVLGQCAAAGVKAAVVIAAGGREIGAKGREVEERLLAASEGKVRLVGPNCLGIIVPGHRLNASFAAGMPSPGHLAFVSQSGAVCTAILDLAFSEGIGFSHFVSIGSMLDVDFGDAIDFLGRAPEVKSILLYVEQLTNIRKFISAARAVSRVKPIIVLKAGSSAAGARAAASHTGAMAGEDAMYDTAFRRAGVIRVRTLGELFDCAEVLAKQPRPRGPQLAVLTNGGGPGVMAVDAMAGHGIAPYTLGPATLAALDRILPPGWSRQNPVDILGDAPAERYAQAMAILLAEPGLHALLVILTPQAVTDPLAVANDLVRLAGSHDLPLFAVWMGGRDVAAAIRLLNEAGIATFATPERAIQAFSFLLQYVGNQKLMLEIPPRLSRQLVYDQTRGRAAIGSPVRPGFLAEEGVRELLLAYGLPLARNLTARSGEEAVAQAEKLGWPVVLKVLAPEISHKTEADGVHLDLRSGEEVLRAYGRIIEGARRYKPETTVAGVTVQPYLAQADYEVLFGVKHDPAFGPVLVFGMGGMYTEVLADRALALPPLNRLLCQRLMAETRLYTLLRGYRNRPPADLTALEQILLQLSQLVVDIPEIAELDLNPVLIKNGRPLVVDARVVLQPAQLPSPRHLVISPYPGQYQLCTTTRGGLRLLLRPIRPEDAELFRDLFASLSPNSVYSRFFSHIRKLSPEMLAMLTQVDYDRQMALVAIDLSAQEERMLGVARVIADPDWSNCEFSIMVGDPWQGRGVGAELLRHLLRIARDQGVKKVWGTVLAENVQMLRLAKEQGFTVKRNPGEGTYDLRLDFAILSAGGGGEARLTPRPGQPGRGPGGEADRNPGD
jgi:acetyltransferase